MPGSCAWGRRSMISDRRGGGQTRARDARPSHDRNAVLNLYSQRPGTLTITVRVSRLPSSVSTSISIR